VSAAEKEKRKKLQVTEWAKKPPCTMCASTTHGWGDCKLKAKCAFLACQCARDKACWIDADEMPNDKELLNALGKPIVGKLKEKLIKFRTDKGKTVSSIEMCNECDESEVTELECSVLEELDLNVDANTATSSCLAPSTSTICDIPTAVLARIVELSHGANPFVLTAVSHGFECAVHDYVDGIYEAEERKYAIEVADIKLKVDTQRKALAASPSLRAVCATQIQEAVKRFLARRHHICGIELEISSAALAADTEPTIKVQIDGGANTNPPMPPPTPIVVKAGYEPLPDGTRLEMCFDIDKNKATWFPATVIKSHKQESGKVFTELSWDDKSWADDPKWKGKLYDLTSQLQPWRPITMPAAAAPVPTAPIGIAPVTAPPRGAPRRVLRSAGLSMPVSAALEHILPGLSETASIDTFNAIAHQWLGHIVPIEVHSIEELDEARELIHKIECSLSNVDPFQAEVSAAELAENLEVSKVLKNVIDVKSASGEWFTITIPKNERALRNDPHEAEWRAAHQVAHESVLANPLNKLVKRKDAKANGAIIALYIFPNQNTS